jgi:copper chaperone
MQKITLKIDGMMCGMCESHINDAIRNAVSVKKVSSSHSRGETVILTDTDISEAKLKEIIDKTGYQLISIKSEPYEKKGLFSKFSKA